MTYSSTGPKPFERASKSSHHHIINDAEVVAVLKQLYVPPQSTKEDLISSVELFSPVESQIQHIVAIDGGYTEVPIKEGYPAATIHFFQFGALHFRREDLKAIEKSPHVSPEDFQKLKAIERVKFPLATKGTRRKDLSSLPETVRRSIHEFLMKQNLGEPDNLLDTLAWFLFKRYKGSARESSDKCHVLTSNPWGVEGTVSLNEDQMSSDFSFVCPATGKKIYLSDVFRLHERIDEETGAAGIAGYLLGAVEHLLLLHIIRNLIRKNATSLKSVLFIMDRPTGWFGLTAPMHKPMLELTNWLFTNHALYLAGLEKSGAFVEHAMALQSHMPAGSFLILDDGYIYRHISPGEEDPSRPYAATSYYGHKLIFKTRQGQMYVVSLPVRAMQKYPKAADLTNLGAILTHVEELHCDMYENALLPIALANKLVSLSAHPSSQILRNFAQSTVSKP